MKYTKEDFEKARFAKHESGEAIAVRWTKDYTSEPDADWVYERPLNNRFSKEATHQEMADMGGWVPVTPARTVTDSEVGEACGAYCPEGFMDGYILGFQDAGGTIIDDPEPTNTEKLADILVEAFNSMEFDLEDSFREIAAVLDKHGVRAGDA